jgi:hypothetical protein
MGPSAGGAPTAGAGGISSRARYSFVSDSVGTLTVLARYTLNREAADVELGFYGPDLEPLGSLTGQTVDAGTNWSDVETLTGVEFDANGDPVGPIYCVAFATETADDGELNRDLQPKPALQKGTSVLTDLLNARQFAFDSAAHPNGECVLSLSVHSGFAHPELEWGLEEMQGSTLTSDPDPAIGQSVTFTYTTLPASNDEFGDKTLTLSHPEIPHAVTPTVQVFFERDATNHPGPDTGTTPNWYYYWSQTSANAGAHEYGGSHPEQYTGQTLGLGDPLGSDGWVCYIYDHARLELPDVIGWGQPEGIDVFAWVTRHEAQHLDDLSGWWPQGWRVTDTDYDGYFQEGDLLPTTYEQDSDGLYDPTKIYTNLDEWGYWKFDWPISDVEHHALSNQEEWGNGAADAEDWAAPGKQWKQVAP